MLCARHDAKDLGLALVDSMAVRARVAREAFAAIDADGNGLVAAAELVATFRQLEKDPSLFDDLLKFEEIDDAGGDGNVTCEEFVDFVVGQPMGSPTGAWVGALCVQAREQRARSKWRQARTAALRAGRSMAWRGVESRARLAATRAFTALDVGGDNKISLSELSLSLQGLSNSLAMNMLELQKMFHAMDADRDGFVSRAELLAFAGEHANDEVLAMWLERAGGKAEGEPLYLEEARQQDGECGAVLSSTDERAWAVALSEARATARVVFGMCGAEYRSTAGDAPMLVPLPLLRGAVDDPTVVALLGHVEARIESVVPGHASCTSTDDFALLLLELTGETALEEWAQTLPSRNGLEFESASDDEEALDEEAVGGGPAVNSALVAAFAVYRDGDSDSDDLEGTDADTDDEGPASAGGRAVILASSRTHSAAKRASSLAASMGSTHHTACDSDDLEGTEDGSETCSSSGSDTGGSEHNHEGRDVFAPLPPSVAIMLQGLRSPADGAAGASRTNVASGPVIRRSQSSRGSEIVTRKRGKTSAIALVSKFRLKEEQAARVQAAADALALRQREEEKQRVGRELEAALERQAKLEAAQETAERLLKRSAKNAAEQRRREAEHALTNEAARAAMAEEVAAAQRAQAQAIKAQLDTKAQQLARRRQSLAERARKQNHEEGERIVELRQQKQREAWQRERRQAQEARIREQERHKRQRAQHSAAARSRTVASEVASARAAAAAAAATSPASGVEDCRSHKDAHASALSRSQNGRSGAGQQQHQNRPTVRGRQPVAAGPLARATLSVAAVPPQREPARAAPTAAATPTAAAVAAEARPAVPTMSSLPATPAPARPGPTGPRTVRLGSGLVDSKHQTLRRLLEVRSQLLHAACTHRMRCLCIELAC